jgi:carbamate kinase
MRIVVALGGNALLQRDERPDAVVQRRHVRQAATALNAGVGLTGVEAVVDKDLTAAELAIALKADRLLVLTDVPAVFRDYGTPSAEPIHAIDVSGLSAMTFPAGSMAPKVEACIRFVKASGQPAAIGALTDAAGVLAGRAGTTIGAALHLLRGSSSGSRYSRLIGPIAVTCVTYSPDFAQWKCGVPAGRTMTAPGGYACSFPSSNSSPRPI